MNSLADLYTEVMENKSECLSSGAQTNPIADVLSQLKMKLQETKRIMAGNRTAELWLQYIEMVDLI